MKTSNTTFSINNERGVLTLDFIFALTVTVGLITVLLAVSWSLAVFEVTQYVSFAVARNYAGTHVSEQEQKAQALRKYVQLTSTNKIFAALYTSSWFKVSTPGEMSGNIGDFNAEYPQDLGPEAASFVGARVQINAKALEINFPLIGNTYEEEDGFKTHLSSYVLRSPSQAECLDFNKQRFERIKQLDPAYSAAPSNEAATISDNGC